MGRATSNTQRLFTGNEDIPRMRSRILSMYRASQKPSFLFSTGDGIRSSGGKGSWRAACLDALDGWWEAAGVAAAVLENPQTTPALWHDAFLKTVVPRMPLFGLGYWAKFVFGDIGLLSSRASLEEYTIVGVGCLALLFSWGLRFPRGVLAWETYVTILHTSLVACTWRAIVYAP